MYGAGIIEDLEEKEVEGGCQTFYVLRISVGNLKIMVSACKAENIGIREVYDKETVISTLKSVIPKPVIMSENWNQRYRENMEIIKTGGLADVALVFRNLLLREKERGLSSAEKKVLTAAKQIIVSEIILSQDVDKSIAEQVLLDTLDNVEMCV